MRIVNVQQREDYYRRTGPNAIDYLQRDFEKRIRHSREYPLGAETPLGHTYSLMLECMVRHGIDPPSVDEFLTTVQGPSPLDAPRDGLMTPTYYHLYGIRAMDYAHKCGLTHEAIVGILGEIIGPAAAQEVAWQYE